MKTFLFVLGIIGIAFSDIMMIYTIIICWSAMPVIVSIILMIYLIVMNIATIDYLAAFYRS